MSRLLRRIVLPALLIACSLAPDANALQLGIVDPRIELAGTAADFALGTQRTKAAGGGVWRIQLSWRKVAPSKPPTNADATNPGWPGYDWSQPDRLIRQITAAGLTPLPFVIAAPDWAEGPNRPTEQIAPAGTWRPDPASVSNFATALAKRYSGTYVDPSIPGTTALPRVPVLQAWNEPNLSEDLTPQWTKRGTTWTSSSPATYRTLLNAFYAGVKVAHAGTKVLTAATAPFGDLAPGGARTQPALFWRNLLCFRTRSSKAPLKSCPTVHFDAFAHNPYPIGPPTQTARNTDDVTVPDLAKITHLVTAAERTGIVRPSGKKALWVTEISWDSAPDPSGLSLASQATYLEGALNVLWREGASVIIWFNLRDQLPVPSYAATYQSGLFTAGPTIASDTPKPALTAFSFPFTAYRVRGVAQLWGMAPIDQPDQPVQIEVLRDGLWGRVLSLTPTDSRIFVGKLRVGKGTQLRAVVGSRASLPWTSE